MREIANTYSWVSLVERIDNGGKGAAVKAGMKAANDQGFTHILQIDADDQHDTNDIPRILSLSETHPQAVISGKPVYRNVPKIRYYGRYLTHIWVWINTLSLEIQDSMCGFRIYPLASSLGVVNSERVGNRMDFDTEILVRLHWQGVQVVQFPTLVTYPADGISHFRGLSDNILISWMHTRLFFGMLQRLPRLLTKKGSKRAEKQ
ncbi:UNVERIFIED_CONTAM: hypothetical protein GTU68_035013 [Idotea baltica]|nr:hypothetical protein [Idotea baltica]